jgi:hypothetical protein
LRDAAEIQKGLLEPDAGHFGRQMRYAYLRWLTAEAIQRFEQGAESEVRQMREEARSMVRKFKGQVEFTREQQEWANAIEAGS